MAVSDGKKFEQDFKASVPESVWLHRLNDSASSYQGGDKARFTPTNICDFIMYDDSLYLLELKSTKAKSLPISDIRLALYNDKHKIKLVINGERVKPKTGSVKLNQVKGMRDAFVKNNAIKAGFVINFRGEEETYFLHISEFMSFLDEFDTKSIPIYFCRDKGIRINQEKKRVRYRYDIEGFVTNLM